MVMWDSEMYYSDNLLQGACWMSSQILSFCTCHCFMLRACCPQSAPSQCLITERAGSGSNTVSSETSLARGFGWNTANDLCGTFSLKCDTVRDGSTFIFHSTAARSASWYTLLLPFVVPCIIESLANVHLYFSLKISWHQAFSNQVVGWLFEAILFTGKVESILNTKIFRNERALWG